MHLNRPQTLHDWGRIVVISPHLDDAVLSCGHVLAGSRGACIVTVFAGDAPNPEMRTPWDASCGHENARAAMHARREEDHDAAAILQASALHLAFPDGQYVEKHVPAAERCNAAAIALHSPAALARGLTEALAQLHFDTLLLPLGLHHSDHQRVAAAWQHAAFVACPTAKWVAYEDVPYRRIGNSVQEALGVLQGNAMAASPVYWDRAPHEDEHAGALKKRALNAYRSQLKVLPEEWLADAMRPESYWCLQRE